jgi:hypothetical protein
MSQEEVQFGLFINIVAFYNRLTILWRPFHT